MRSGREYMSDDGGTSMYAEGDNGEVIGTNCVQPRTKVTVMSSKPSREASILPYEFQNKLAKLFTQIELEFEKEYRKLYQENYALQEKLEKYEELADHMEGKVAPRRIGPVQLSQKIKQQYKHSTSKVLNSLRQNQLSQGLSFTVNQSVDKHPVSYHANILWEKVVALVGHLDGIWDISCSSQLGIIASASSDCTVRLWSLDQNVEQLLYLGHQNSVNSVRLYNDCLVTSCGDGTAHIVHLTEFRNFLGESNDEEVKKVQQEKRFHDGFKADNLNFFFEDNEVVVRTAGMVLSESDEVLVAADFLESQTSSEPYVVTGGWERVGRIYDVGDGGVLLVQLTGHEDRITDLHCSGGRVLSSSADGTFRLWDYRISGNNEVHVQQCHSHVVSTAKFSGEHNIVTAGGTTDRCLKMWDVRNFRGPLWNVRLNAGVNRISISNSPSCVFAPLDNGAVEVVELNSGYHLGRLPKDIHSPRIVMCCAWEPVSSHLYIGGFDNQIRKCHLHSCPVVSCP